MDTLPIDLPELVAAVMGSLLVLIPVLGLALRWAAKPLAEALEHEVHQLAPGAEVRALPPPVRGPGART